MLNNKLLDINYINDETKENMKEIYSTTEVKTNKVWIDGKPIYRKVLKGEYSTSGSSSFSINLPVGSSVDTMIDYFGTHGMKTGSLARIINKIGQPTVSGINYSSTMYYEKTTNNIVVDISGKSSSATAWCEVIVEYTKTTD